MFLALLGTTSPALAGSLGVPLLQAGVRVRVPLGLCLRRAFRTSGWPLLAEGWGRA